MSRSKTEPLDFQSAREIALALPILVRLSKVDRDALAKLLEDAWRQGAPKRLVAEYDRVLGGRL